MSLESGNMGAYRTENHFNPGREVLLNLPKTLGNLPFEERARFDDLMMSVIPWRGEGYTLGLNGLFKFIPMGTVEQVERYVHELPGESHDSIREKLVESMKEVFDERGFAKMNEQVLRSFT